MSQSFITSQNIIEGLTNPINTSLITCPNFLIGEDGKSINTQNNRGTNGNKSTTESLPNISKKNSFFPFCC